MDQLLGNSVIPGVAEGGQTLNGVSVLHAVLVDFQTGGDDVGAGNSTVGDLLGVADSSADDLGLAVEAVVLVDLDDVLDVLLAVLAVGFLPADEGRDEQRAVLGGQDGHGGGEDQGDVGADALSLQTTGGNNTSLGAGDLDGD